MNTMILKCNALKACLIILFLVGCATDSFKESCLKSGLILKNAKQLLQISSSENIANKKNIKSTIVRFDNKKAKEYLHSKERELHICYEKIKGNLDKTDVNSNDVLFILAFINEMTYLLSGKAIEDRCLYINRIEGKKNAKLSQWVVDEFFGPILTDKNSIILWLDMDNHSKYELIYGFLFVPNEKGEICGKPVITEGKSGR